MTSTFGEAPETESEEEIDTENPQSDKVKTKKKKVHELVMPVTASPSSGRIVAGEAPESDDEIEEVASISSAASVSSLASATSLSNLQQQVTDGKKQKEEVKYKSLLHKKLRAKNSQMWRGINDLAHLNINQAARDLNFADQQLLKSQGVLQDTSAQLRILGSNLTQLNELLNLITASPFLPNVQIPEQNE
ncbi:Hypothetical predicted protein [Cloeon dipterum]|uniref:Biogenesis of lysosome-related organelles complex 1 subunit 3 n=1 Tax=Cloeon dipterum TaxID=197152 RepID=A0A8S1DDB7_9INSE|nr:Hypothetical predicted protein [Cloeon dipterum]